MYVASLCVHVNDFHVLSTCMWKTVITVRSVFSPFTSSRQPFFWCLWHSVYPGQSFFLLLPSPRRRTSITGVCFHICFFFFLNMGSKVHTQVIRFGQPVTLPAGSTSQIKMSTFINLFLKITVGIHILRVYHSNSCPLHSATFDFLVIPFDLWADHIAKYIILIFFSFYVYVCFACM